MEKEEGVMYELSNKLPKECSDIVREFVKTICKNELRNSRRVSKNHLPALKSAISCFIRNYLLSNKKRMVVPLDQTIYSKPVIVNGSLSTMKISYTFTRKFIEYLVDEDYITLEKGGCIFSQEAVPQNIFALNTNENKVVVKGTFPSYVFFTDKFNKLFPSEKLSRVVRDNVIIVRDKDGFPVTFKLSAESIKSRDIIKEYNRFSLTKRVVFDGEEYDVQCYRLFNLKQKFGGRLYMGGSVQSLTSEQRSRITIEGRKTARFDYVGFEPSILYSVAGEILKDDPYELQDDRYKDYDRSFLRSFCKRVMLVMLNSKDSDQVPYYLNSYVRDELDVDRLHSEGKIPTNRIPVLQIIQDLENKHLKIADKFYKSCWKEVQYIGSTIMQGVAEYLMQRHECLVLQVFDECIVEEEYAQELYEAMHVIYNEVTGFTGNCRVVREN